MLNTPANASHVVIIGAGPYGLSLAAHLRFKKVPFRIFGKAMHTWSTQMPEGILLNSAGAALDLCPGTESFSFTQFCRQTNRPYEADAPVPLEDFTAYGQEFARRFVPDLEPEHIKSVDCADDLFRITTTSGECFFASHVIVATGLSLFAHLPAEFKHLPALRVTHPSQHRSFAQFAGRNVTVLGRGASALTSAVMLHEAGARVTLIARSSRIRFEQSLSPAALAGSSRGTTLSNRLPDLLHRLPAALRSRILRRKVQPRGQPWLQEQMQGFPIFTGTKLHAIEAADGSGERLRLTLTNSRGELRRHLTSHVIAATGYRVGMDRLSMLSATVRERVRTDRQGAPKLNRSFQSSLSGLYFIGPLAAPQFGPSLATVAGAAFTAERLSLALQRDLLQQRRRAINAPSFSAVVRERRL